MPCRLNTHARNSANTHSTISSTTFRRFPMAPPGGVYPGESQIGRKALPPGHARPPTIITFLQGGCAGLSKLGSDVDFRGLRSSPV
jgi:hypothetical protein